VTTDPRIDTYIKKAPAYAQPILTHIRQVVHDACPDVQETLKWRSPTFVHHGILCGMAAFKHSALLGFWKSKVLVDRGFAEVGRLTSVADLPPDAELRRMIKAAMLLNEQGITLARPKRAKKPPVQR